MSKSGKALKGLSTAVPELCLCKDLLVVAPTEHILRCFIFERTPYKGLFYFWRVVIPLYSPFPVFHLSHGQRLADGDYIDLSASKLELSIERMVNIILGGELEYLRGVDSPRRFLEEFGGELRENGYAPQIMGFEAGLTYYLLGNIRYCLDNLDEFASEDLEYGSTNLRWSARDFARELRADPSAGARKIEALERVNIERWGLAPSLKTGDPRRGAS